jgi:hypothetical protein
MNQAVEVASGGRVYITSYIKIGSSVQKLLREIHIQTDTHRQEGDNISLLFFFSKQ